MPYIKKGDFIRTLLKKRADADTVDIAVSHGWAEAQDIREASEDLSRLEAARITHMFMLKEMGIPDLADISGASVLRDLYDCRVCVNHIAQVYLRGLMEAKEIERISSQRFLIFDGKEKLTVTEAEKIYRGLDDPGINTL